MKAKPNKRNLSEVFVKKLEPQLSKFLVWDTKQRGLAVVVQPTGQKAWKCVYSRHGRPRWFHIGVVGAIDLNAARKRAAKLMYQVSEGADPAAARKAERFEGTFADLATRYISEYAMKKNKSWKQADGHLKRHVIPRLGKLASADISRGDIKAMMRGIAAPISANQALAHCSAVFAWAIKEDILITNPCNKVDRNDTKARERVLSETEIPLFWEAFDDVDYVQGMALKMILLTGQRPGEVAHMRSEHIVDGWWTLPGEPVPALDWPGTKNGASHRVWLPKPALALLEDMEREGLVFVGPRGRAIANLDAAMRDISDKLDVDPATPHDLRRTHGTTITGLGFGRDAMNRVQNHKEGGIASVYDRHRYADENQKIMEAVASRIVTLAEGNVVPLRRRNVS